MGKRSQLGDPTAVIFVRSGRICRHDEIESGEHRVAHPLIVGTFIKNQSTWHTRTGRCRFSQLGITLETLGSFAIRMTQKLPVETDNDRRASGFGRIENTLQRFEIPALEVTKRVAVFARVVNEFANWPERHAGETPLWAEWRH